MDISSLDSLDNKRHYKTLLDACARIQSDEYIDALHRFFHPSARINVVQPINAVNGLEEFESRVMNPMSNAFGHLHRRTDVLFGGEYQGGEWVVSHGHYVGKFVRDWMGIPASGEIVWLHYIEYHRMEGSQAVETYLFFDMLDLLRQIGRCPVEKSLGYEGFVPGPATGDGIILERPLAGESATSLKIVDDMLAELWTDDQRWRRYWHPNMYWYGPSGYGSQIGVDGFERFQLPYEAMFEKNRFSGEFRSSGDAELDSKVKGHFARFAEGNYVASGGWPSHGGFMVSDWLGVKAAGQMFTVRVADIWRRSGDLLVENWVFVDLVDMLLQLGVDVFDVAGIRIEV